MSKTRTRSSGKGGGDVTQSSTRLGAREIQDHEGLTGWGGKYITDRIRITRYMEDAKTWLVEKQDIDRKIGMSGLENLSRGDRISYECHQAMLHWLIWKMVPDSGLEGPCHEGWVDGEEALVEMLTDYSLTYEDASPTPAVEWLFRWLEDGPPEVVNPAMSEGIAPEWAPRKAGSSFGHNSPWAGSKNGVR